MKRYQPTATICSTDGAQLTAGAWISREDRGADRGRHGPAAALEDLQISGVTLSEASRLTKTHTRAGACWCMSVRLASGLSQEGEEFTVHSDAIVDDKKYSTKTDFFAGLYSRDPLLSIYLSVYLSACLSLLHKPLSSALQPHSLTHDHLYLLL